MCAEGNSISSNILPKRLQQYAKTTACGLKICQSVKVINYCTAKNTPNFAPLQQLDFLQ